MASRLNLPRLFAVNGSGEPIAGGKLYFYVAGTTTPLDTYSDAGLTTPNANPVVADADGVWGDIFLADGASYKVELKTSADVTVWTADNVTNGAIATIATIAALKAVSTTLAAVYGVVTVKGYYATGDGGEGQFYWDSTSSATDNGGTVIRPDSAPAQGRWRRLLFGQPLNVQMFGAKGDGLTDGTTAFQAAIDAARSTSYTSENNIRGNTVTVPYTASGYKISSINLYTGIAFLGVGGRVLIQQNTSDGTHMIVLDGRNDGITGQHEQSRIENFSLVGSYQAGGTGDVLHFIEHDNNVVKNVHIHNGGGYGIYGAKKSGGSKSDGLLLESVFVSNCGKAGIYAGSNSHYWTLVDCRVVNNGVSGGYPNLDISCVGFAMFGGVVNLPNDAVGLRFWNSNSGGCWGVSFEATPSHDTGTGYLLQIGDSTLGAARGMTFAGNNYTASGSTAAVYLVYVNNAVQCSIIGGQYDANSSAAVTGIVVGASADETLIDNPRFAGNSGAGGWTDYTNSGANTDIRLGIRRPLKPMLLAKADGSQTNVAADSNVKVLFATEIFDVGSNFASSSFTAPVTGKYFVQSALNLAGINTAATNLSLRTVSSNNTFILDFTPSALGASWPAGAGYLMDMDEGDTCQIQVRQSGGSAQMDINTNSTLSIFLVG